MTDVWDSLTGTPEPLGISTSPIGKKYEQSCGLTVDATALPAYVTTEAPNNESMFSVRFYVLASELSMAADEEVTILRARDNATTEVEVRLRSSGMVKNLTAFYRSGAR